MAHLERWARDENLSFRPVCFDSVRPARAGFENAGRSGNPKSLVRRMSHHRFDRFCGLGFGPQKRDVVLCDCWRPIRDTVVLFSCRPLLEADVKKEPNQTPEPTAPSGRGSS